MKSVRLKNRPGFESFGMRLLYRILYPFIHCRLIYSEEIPEDGEPTVYVANHYNVFGPPSFILSVPTVNRFWSNEDINTPEAAIKTIYPDIRSALPFLGEKGAHWICSWLGPFVSNVLQHFNPISVSRHDPAKLFSTMRQSVSVLQKGESMIIFPETGLPEYSLTSVTPFFSGFATVGMIYYRKTGKKLRFCPCYIDEQHHVIHFGKLVTYNPEGTVITEESDRVSDELNLQIREMAAESRKPPREKASPLRRTVMFFCNLLSFLLLIPLIIFCSSGNSHLTIVFYTITQGLRILFNAAAPGNYAASNPGASLLSHTLSLAADICVLSFLNISHPAVRILLWTLIANALICVLSNIISLIRTRWCAGCNYFDVLSAHLICFICFQQLLNISLVSFFLDWILIAAYIFLGLSTAYSVIYNLRYREAAVSE